VIENAERQVDVQVEVLKGIYIQHLEDNAHSALA
jgi:hypothetical protein